MQSPLRANVLSFHSEALLKEKHSSSEPYRHIVIQDLCDTERMLQVQHEAKENLTANFKETDLFKVYQTGELGNFDDKDPVMQQRFPHLLSLRNAIYSEPFREFIARVMGVDDLTTRVDCSCNAYTQGCHLLCHDDVIGTRRISYIIYLTDQDWQTQDGGALELYPIEESSKVVHDHEDGSTSFQGIPTASPTRLILPTFNSMVLFRVQPGRSYHSVQEVYSDDKPRLSISGWFHGPSPPPGADLASLNQIMTKGDDIRDFSPFVVTSSSSPTKSAAKPRGIGVKKTHGLISSDDMDILSKWVNPIYLKASEIKKINEEFCSDSSIQVK
jgi:prolyl 3-hydroxylase /prolyl 3,4-dihydroxylase